MFPVGREGGRVQRVRRDRRLRRPERDGFQNNGRALRPSGHRSDERECCTVRTPTDLEPCRRGRVRQVVWHGGAELYGGQRELPEGPRSVRKESGNGEGGSLSYKLRCCCELISSGLWWLRGARANPAPRKW